LKFKNHETIIFDKFSQTTKGTKTETCLIWHTLSAIFIIPVHGTYTIDLANGQCLSKCHDTLSLKITSYQWMDKENWKEQWVRSYWTQILHDFLKRLFSLLMNYLKELHYPWEKETTDSPQVKREKGRKITRNPTACLI
jgi:UDP-2,3-diacylglucosamine pyrophosphatase LpxH